MIITIDGPSGTGKSTVAKLSAKKIGATFVDTGAMFRSLAAAILEAQISCDDEEAIARFIKENSLRLEHQEEKLHYFVGSLDVTSMLRTPQVTDAASRISKHEVVRSQLAFLQRQIAKECQEKNISTVFEGRDMGTVIFPHADLKIFLTATPDVRAHRRYKEMIEKEPTLAETLSFEALKQEIIARDERDSTRALAPLKAATDAHIIDTSNLSQDEVVAQVVQLTRACSVWVNMFG